MRATSSRSERSTTLLGVVDGAGFTDDGDLDLTGIFELVFDPAGDVLREPDGFFVGNLLALDHDADFPARLDRERLRHALEGVGDAFELFQTLDVGLEDVAACAGPRRRDGVGRLD